MLDQIGRQFGRDERDAPRLLVVQSRALGLFAGEAAGLADLALLRHAQRSHGILPAINQRQRASITFVPCPTADSTLNSLHSRFAPLSPSPSPDPVV